MRRVAMLTGSISRQSGGLFNSVRFLAQSLAVKGLDVHVLSAIDKDSQRDFNAWNPLEPDLCVSRGPRFIRYMPGLQKRLSELNPDLVHTQHLWLYTSVVAECWARQSKKPYIVSPRGMLDSWALKHSMWKKRLIAALYENRHLRNATCLHALCESEAQAMRAYGLENPICIIPNGVSLPAHELSTVVPQWRMELPENSKILLFLGRIHPKKGLQELLEAWELVSAANDHQWNLVIAGWDDGGHLSKLVNQLDQMKSAASVHFVGPQYGDDKLSTLRCADAFVLPSFSEGLPMAVLEAWAHNLPVIMTQACNLSEGFDAGAAINVSPKAENLAEGLYKLMKMTEEDRVLMGAAGRRLVERQFTWSVIADKLDKVYAWILGIGSQPANIKVI